VCLWGMHESMWLCCSVLQPVLQCVAACSACIRAHGCALQCVAVCCSVLQCVAGYDASVLKSTRQVAVMSQDSCVSMT